MPAGFGLEGWEALLPQGLPRPGSLLVQGPPGAEKDVLLLQFAAEGLRAGEGVLIILSSKSPARFLRELQRLGVKPEVPLQEGRLKILDWYTQQEQAVGEVADVGGIVTVPSDPPALSTALSRILTSSELLRGGRATVDLLPNTLSPEALNQTVALMGEARAVVQALGMVGLFVLDKGQHDSATLEVLQANMDGVVDIERGLEGGKQVRSIALEALGGRPTGLPRLRMEVSRDGRLSIAAPTAHGGGSPSPLDRQLEILRADPHNIEAMLSLAQLHQTAKRALEAEQWVRAALKVKPDPASWRLLAAILQDQGRNREAEEALAATRPAPPQPPPPPPPPPIATASPRPEMEINLQGGPVEDVREKVPCLTCGSMLDSEAEICYACGAVVPREEARRVRIISLLRICDQRLQWDRKDGDAWFTKAAALGRMKDFRGAIAALNELTKLNHEYPGLWILKGKFYSRLGDQDMARLCRRRALEQEGGNRTTSPVPPPPQRAPPAEATFQCPVCGRQLPVEANECECGAEFEDDPHP